MWILCLEGVERLLDFANVFKGCVECLEVV